MAKKYIVDLTQAERSHLESITKTGKHKARSITRANILLMANEGYLDSEIASTLRVNVSTVERTREKFVVGGLEYAIQDRPHPPKSRKLDGKQEAFLIATACSNPPEGRNNWTMQLLADRLINLGIVDSISDETVRQTLKKTRSNRG
jgi:transposase